MRDGYSIYRRRDADGMLPTLDDDDGHTGVTADSPAAPVYHYHVNEQTSTGARTAGDKQWSITKGRYHSAPAACSKCCGATPCSADPSNHRRKHTSMSSSLKFAAHVSSERRQPTRHEGASPRQTDLW